MRLVAESLKAERGGEPVFGGISFTVNSGEALLVTGENGSGKSTLLRALAGLLAPTAGSVRLEGHETEDLAGACHYLGHSNAMKTALSVSENLHFWQDFLGDPELSAAEALEMVGLQDIGHLPFEYLSTGQRRRVAIARLLVSARPVWLLDEPTSGLDKASERRFAGLMREHLEAGGIIVAATHMPLGLDDAAELRLGAAA
jgi:heme exporter protein A